MVCDGTSAISVGKSFGIDKLVIYSWIKKTGVQRGVSLTEDELNLAMGDWKWKYPDGPSTKAQVKDVKKRLRENALPNEPTPESMTSAVTVRSNYNQTLERVGLQVISKLSSDTTIAGTLKATLAMAYIDLLKESLVNMPPVEKISDLRTLQSLLFETLDIGGKEGPKRQGIDLRILNMDPKKIRVIEAVETPEPIDVEVVTQPDVGADTPDEIDEDTPDDDDFYL